MDVLFIMSFVAVVIGCLISVVSAILDTYFKLERSHIRGNRLSISRKKTLTVSKNAPQHVLHK